MPRGFAQLNDSDWNWIVFRPALIGEIVDGIAESSRWQSARSSGPSERVAQAADLLAGVRTSTRATPPSEPTKAIPGFDEANTIACSSGCRPLVKAYAGAAPSVAVMSAQV